MRLTMRGRIQAIKTMDKKAAKSKLKGQPPLLGSLALVGSRQQSLTDGNLDVCPKCCGCRVTVSDEVNALQCYLCESPDMWKCTDCLGIPPSLYSALFGCKELRWLCADCDKGCSKTKDNSDRGSKNAEMLDEILRSINRVFEKLGGVEKLKGKVDISDIVRLEERITALEARLEVCEERSGECSSGSVAAGVAERLVVPLDRMPAGQLTPYEIEERERRKSCVIIHGVVESESEDPVVRRDEDLILIASMFHKMDCDDVKVEKAFRLGKRLNHVVDEGEKKRSRPLKLVLDSEDNRRKVLIRAKNLRLKEEGDWVNIVIHQDLTPIEIAERKLVLEEMRPKKNIVCFP